MLLSLPILLSTLFAADAVVPGRPVTPTAPWAIVPDDGPRSYLERVAGRPVDPRTIKPVRRGNMMFDGESMGLDQLKALDIPLAALDHDPTPGVLFVAMDGVTVSPTCNSGQTANAARNCSPLVDAETSFPALAGGNGQVKGAEFQKLSGYYAPFDLVLSSQRPPDYLPYTMAVIGGTSGQAGQPNGVCGIANVACDGAKRNHVSLTFSDSCSGDVAEIAAQETAHNWGLEHTDLQSDLMYPYIAGGSEFRDECMAINHDTGSGTTQCGYVHKLYCPDGAGEQQNSYTELMGVFGPRKEDTVKPTISAVTPEDGATITSAETLTIGATITDDSNFIGVNWTWVEGLPAELQEDGYRRCTNDVCTDNYPAWRGMDEPWDFLVIKGPPPGTYKFKVEAMDAYGNYAAKTITLTVVEGGSDETGGTGGSDSATGETGGDPTEDVPTTDGQQPGGPTAVATAGDSSSSGDDAGGSGDDGGCRLAGSPGPAALLLLLGFAGRRRRTARRA